MAIPVTVEIILIAAITGIIAICVYILYLVDKLLSRIEALEKTVRDSLAIRSKSDDVEVIKKTLASAIEQINNINEVLESTGKDIDSINVKISASIGGIAATNEKVDSIEEKVFENRSELLQARREIATLARKLEQLEKDTELIAARQQLGGEF